jgi:hypothetical protein
MSALLLNQRCLLHAEREAVARCPECTRFYCRECVSEHEGRVLCARCLAKQTAPETQRRSRFGGLLRATGAMFGVLVAWWFFDLIGRGLMLLPASVHEGTVWEEFDRPE